MPRVLLVSLRSGVTSALVAAAEHRDFLEATRMQPEDMPLVVLDSPEAAIGDLSGFDGVLIGGSSLNITNEQWGEWQHHVHAQLRTIIDAGIPAFFVCYGTSWLVHELGGRIGHGHAEKTGSTIVELTSEGQKDPLTQGLPQTFTSLTGHTENVEEVGPGVVTLATGPTCPVQFIRFGDHVWATQFHSDMDAVAMKARMDFFYDYGYFSPEDYDAIVATLPEIDTTWSNRLVENFVRYCGGNSAN
ncbi:glutamine amidotransferase [Corynebacterium testudinoris]|uniref:GMP synthase family protein n=1 Tax=Corynebacterium testudinoris TaxID=136857 RepID=A0A0G3H7U0_9CORY|nr:glutamine amidotransferase [Corynebacterium testudinoris]AKK08825.1 GMP synthase family protein [Corynebacterium testudinoris]MBX8994880.1 glutamine amidotransferase [Corynebacterium testudinoris]